MQSFFYPNQISKNIVCRQAFLFFVYIVTTTFAYGDASVAERGKPIASVCDHRYGADATWSHCTDMATKNFYYAEACAFKFNLAMTVFDSPYWQNPDVNLEEKKNAANTGRLTFQVYLQTERWCDPRLSGAKQNFPFIPDYYATTWSQAAVDAGFNVKVGTAKPTRFPNHGMQLFDVSGGKYGYDTKTNTPGKVDVLSGLMEYQRNWIKENFGYYPAAAAYRNGQVGAAYQVPKYFLGARNSAISGESGYGKSKEGCGFLGDGKTHAMPPKVAASIWMTTRNGDMKQPKAQVLAHCGELLQKTIKSRGWYTDFVHWHTSPRGETTLYDFFESQRSGMNGHNVVTLNYGEALEHKFLRDMANVSVEETGDGITLTVTYKDPYGRLPLEVIGIPVSVKVNLSSTSLSGKEISSVDSCGIQKVAKNKFIVEVPFHGKQESVQVHLKKAAGTPEYMNFHLPEVRNISLNKGMLHVEASMLVRLAIFAVPSGSGFENIKIIARSNETSDIHNVNLTEKSAINLQNADIYVGAISQQKQSILYGPVR